MIMLMQGFNIGHVCLDNPLVLAPLAGITNLPFRMITKPFGPAMVVTEMVSAVGLVYRGAKTMKLMTSDPAEHPLAVQIFGRDPDSMAQGAVIAQEAGADLIDINMGCPARKVVRGGSGAGLLKDFGLIEQILKKTRQAVRIPLTVKTRAGWRPGEGEILDLAPVLMDCGVDAVTLHPRYGIQGFSGRADWDIVARFAERFNGPVIGNGDITTPKEAVERLGSHGVAGVMLGRAALGNPWIFRHILDMLQERSPRMPSLDERHRTALRHAGMLKDHVGPDHATLMLRSILMWYTKGLPDSTAFRRSINQIKDFTLLNAMTRDYFERLSMGERLLAVGE